MGFEDRRGEFGEVFLLLFFPFPFAPPAPPPSSPCTPPPPANLRFRGCGLCTNVHS
ncbi:hypothetical protein K440DRAFT_635528 [Wilcoxina mikolae CBS 423.85]|nr:hypothetical protein K440DRAFT_635528 [Wilcoxina mikolae CBS 423.85]